MPKPNLFFRKDLFKAIQQDRKTVTRRLAKIDQQLLKPEPYSEEGTDYQWLLEVAPNHLEKHTPDSLIKKYSIYQAGDRVNAVAVDEVALAPIQITPIQIVTVKCHPLSWIDSHQSLLDEGIQWQPAPITGRGLNLNFPYNKQFFNDQTKIYDLPTYLTCFSSLWDALHTQPGTTWNDNPFVFTIHFERLNEGDLNA